MTDLEQRKIIVLRSEGKSYNAIADEQAIPDVMEMLLRSRYGQG